MRQAAALLRPGLHGEAATLKECLCRGRKGHSEPGEGRASENCHPDSSEEGRKRRRDTPVKRLRALGSVRVADERTFSSTSQGLREGVFVNKNG